MIESFSHATVFVFDQECAKDFYTQKLGFEVRDDVTLGNFRWLTVGAKAQPDLRLILMPLQGSPMSDEVSGLLRKLLETKRLGVGVFDTRDCRKTYAELKAKGVEFTSEPAERPYGIEATFTDDSGNLFSLTQRK